MKFHYISLVQEESEIDDAAQKAKWITELYSYRAEAQAQLNALMSGSCSTETTHNDMGEIETASMRANNLMMTIYELNKSIVQRQAELIAVLSAKSAAVVNVKTKKVA